MFHGIILAMAPAPQNYGSATPQSPIFMVVWLGLMVGIIWGIASLFSKKPPKLVLRKFSINKPGAPTLIEICGRDAGVIGWLLTKMRLKDETMLRITGDQISFVRASLFGKNQQTIPLPSVASASSGYKRPIGFLIFGIFVILLGILSGSGKGIANGIIIAAVFVLLYVLFNKIVVSIETSGGSNIGISFARSVIENIPVDIEQAQQVVDAINREITQRQRR